MVFRGEGGRGRKHGLYYFQECDRDGFPGTAVRQLGFHHASGCYANSTGLYRMENSFRRVSLHHVSVTGETRDESG